MCTKKIFQMVGIIGFVALGSASSCVGMEANPKSAMEIERRVSSDDEDYNDQFSSMSISSSEDTSDFDCIAMLTKILRFQFDYYAKIDNTKAGLRYGESENTKNILLNDLDQGGLVFGIIKTLVDAEYHLNDLKKNIAQFVSIASKRNLTVIESGLKLESIDALRKLNPLVECHKPLLVTAITSFDKTAKLRLFWLLTHQYCPVMRKITKSLVSENNYSNKRAKWLFLAHEGLTKIPSNHATAIQATLSTLLQLPSDNNFYLLLEMSPQN